MRSWFTLAFLAAASALTWLGVRLLGVLLGPTDWLDAVDLEKMTNKNHGCRAATGDKMSGKDSNLLSSSSPPVSLVTLRARFNRSGFGVPDKGGGLGWLFIIEL